MSFGFVKALMSERNALAICLVVYLLVLWNTFVPSPYPGGVDVSTHLFQIGLIADEGFTPWNHWWYAGHPLLDQYPPLPHFLGALIAPFVGVENAYKIIASLFFLLLPVSFYLLAKEKGLKLTEWQRAAALYFFSFSPVYAYHLQGGVASALAALPFAILFLKYLVRGLDAGNWMVETGVSASYREAIRKPGAGNRDGLRACVLSSVFLALTALSHLFTPVAAGLFGALYLVAYNRSFAAVKRFAFVYALAACLIAFFWATLMLDYSISGPPSDLSSLGIKDLVKALAPFGRAFAVYINYFSILTVAAIGLLTAAAAVFYWRGAGGRTDAGNSPRRHLLFFGLCVASVIVWVLFLPFSSEAAGKLSLWIPIFFSLFLCRYADANTFSRAFSTLVLALMLVLVLLVRNSYVPPETYYLAEWAANHTESRALMLPQGVAMMAEYSPKANPDAFYYEMYMLPHYFHKELYNGWFYAAEPRAEIQGIRLNCIEPRAASEILGNIGIFGDSILNTVKRECIPDASQAEFCRAVREGAVDSVFANKNFPNVVEYADGAGCLERKGEYGPLVAYTVLGYEPYVSNGFAYEKKGGAITVFVNGPYSGDVVVRESYYSGWNAYLDKGRIAVEEEAPGYLRVPVDVPGGEHTLALRYEPNRYWGIFGFVSIVAWAALIAFFIKPEWFGKYSKGIEEMMG